MEKSRAGDTNQHCCISPVDFDVRELLLGIKQIKDYLDLGSNSGFIVKLATLDKTLEILTNRSMVRV